ncbi:uncharacterized protein LOC106070676 [Biomphalaria glabrata]|uniref:Uncharacterized protein LOC106070676 n=1 Tax=Biomphalaria glabrata TaxID=6526 RepID=A0A9U8EGT6_BIOGL|nr:uncharacterized protein LOC106070676 [Biomphalaria glabrata]XP_013086082.2 uncharacterized protein LOC106070676 [Biomphalaria glabrata]XP_013086083.2 uncharacterized protein LOC106070676 [Biomphalaria glabrata]XP_055888304.1 uncharacterized protein LOC106070676 [Biomphalaria glabrata]
MYEEATIESCAVERYLKCAKCRNVLKHPTQLSACLHILCSSCFHELETTQISNIICPKCNQQNARPSILKSIAGMDDTFRSYSRCDYCDKVALWNCFICAKYFCASCRPKHDNANGNKGHQLSLLPQPTVALNQKLFANESPQVSMESRQAPPILEVEAIDGGSICPLCSDLDCKHLKVLEKLSKQISVSDGLCEIEGHANHGQQNELKFFCLACWKPVCGDCSQRGDHKLHKVSDLVHLKTYLKDSILKSHSKFTMFDKKLEFDITEYKAVEGSLKKHLEETDNEIKSRKYKIIEEATDAFNAVVQEVELQGKNIFQEYQEKLQKIENCRKLLNLFQGALDKLKVDDNLNIPQYNHVFQCQQDVDTFITDINSMVSYLCRLEERILVLPEIMTTPMLTLARAGTEWKHLKLAFTIPLEAEVRFVHSIVVIGSEQCLLTCQMANSDNDAIVYYDRTNVTFHDVNKGRYLIAQTSDGSIVVSYSKDQKHYIQYNDGRFLEGNGAEMNLRFTTIKEMDYPAYGIATTNDDKVIICYQIAEKKDVNGILKLSLQGKVLKDTYEEPNSNLQCPRYVTVSNTGEIAVSDSIGNSVVILDKDLKVCERVNLGLPSSFIQDGREPLNSVFGPYGLCYDNYGRIIVTDPDNNSVLRLSRDNFTHKYCMQPLLTKNLENVNFNDPHLVALGPDSRLWIVCRAHVLVYDYCS